MAFADTIHTKPEPRPNACPTCGAFRVVGSQYQPPQTHFGGCRHYIDHGVLRIAEADRRDRRATR